MMTNLKRAVIASVVFLLLALWLFGFRLQAEGINLVVVSQMDNAWPFLLGGVALVFFFQLFRVHLSTHKEKVKAGLPEWRLPSQDKNPGCIVAWLFWC